MKAKPSWLYDSRAGWTVHQFMYGYQPIVTAITREALRISAKVCGSFISNDAREIVNPAFSKSEGTLSIRIPYSYKLIVPRA